MGTCASTESAIAAFAPDVQKAKYTFVESKNKAAGHGEVHERVTADKSEVRFRTLSQSRAMPITTGLKIASPDLTSMHYALETKKLASAAGRVVEITSASSRFIMTFKGSRQTKRGICCVHQMGSDEDAPSARNKIMKLNLSNADSPAILSEAAPENGGWQTTAFALYAPDPYPPHWRPEGSSEYTCRKAGFAAEMLAIKDTALTLAVLLAGYLLMYPQVGISREQLLEKLEAAPRRRCPTARPGAESGPWSDWSLVDRYQSLLGDQRQGACPERALFDQVKTWAETERLRPGGGLPLVPEAPPRMAAQAG